MPCNFHKIFIYVIRTLSLIFLYRFETITAGVGSKIYKFNIVIQDLNAEEPCVKLYSCVKLK